MAVAIPIFKLCVAWAEEPDGPRTSVVISPGGTPEVNLKKFLADEIGKENLGHLRSHEQVMQSVADGIDRAFQKFKASAFGK